MKPKDFGEAEVVEVHHFSDASCSGYGQCSYLRLVNESGQVHCSLLIGKSRVVILKPITIPRLELSAALLSVKMGIFLDQELDYANLHTFTGPTVRLYLDIWQMKQGVFMCLSQTESSKSRIIQILHN